MPMTLLEAAKGEQNPLRRGVIQIFAKSSPVLGRIPIMTIAGNAYGYLKEGKLPGVAFRAVNGTYTESSGVLNPEVESLKIVGGEIHVDQFHVKTQPTRNVGEIRAVHTALKVKSLAAYFTKMFFKGDSSTDSAAFDGLQRRISVGSSQLLAMGATSSGDTLTLAKLDELIDLVDGADVLYMNKTMRRKVSALVRAAGQTAEMITDDFGRQVMAYAGIPIVPTETDNDGAEILGFTEADSAGAGTACTSIYAVKWGADEYVALLQSGVMDVVDLGVLQAKPAYGTRVEWYLSPAIFNGRGVARLAFISNT